MKWGPEKWAIDYRDKQPHQLLRHRHRPLQDRLPRPHRRAGLPEAGGPGQATGRHWQLIKKENPFPAVCGRICNRRCEDACTRGTIDQAVAIDEVKKFIAQQDLNAETPLCAAGGAALTAGGCANRRSPSSAAALRV